MSGIYISGAKIPNGDYVRVLMLHKDGTCVDGIGNVFKAVPVPPHGRLIDADALIDAIIAKYIRHERNGELVFAAAEIKQDLADIISELPTIIEAEEGKT